MTALKMQITIKHCIIINLYAVRDLRNKLTKGVAVSLFTALAGGHTYTLAEPAQRVSSGDFRSY